MKILFLNPHIDAQHQITQLLKARGMALLMPANPEEAWQVLRLHGDSVDLAIIHREGIKGGDPGIELLYKIKKDVSQVDLPVIFTSEGWSAEQCAAHQQTPMGANAYLRWPFDGEKLLETINAVFGPEGSAEAPPQVSPQISSPPDTGEFVLEVPSFKEDKPEITSIKLEAPAPGELSPVIELSGSPQPEAAPVSVEAEPSVDLSLISSPEIAPVATVEAVPEELNLDIASDTNPELTRVGQVELHPEVSPTPEAITSPEASPAPEVQVADSEIEQEMPYLFSKPESSRAGHDPAAFSRAFAQPLGDAVVPGGAAHTPDIETLKKYLLLREQDVAALSAQLKAARDELSTVKAQLTAEHSHSEGLQLTVQDQKRKIEDFEREKALALEGLHSELAELRFQTKAKSDKAKLLEGQVHEATGEIERLKERVRSDIRKIRVRERELENKLEISKRDSEAVLASREGKIIELKRKLDVLEFNMDLLQDRFSREKEASTKLRDKLLKAAQVVRVAEGLLDDPGTARVTPPSEDTQAS